MLTPSNEPKLVDALLKDLNPIHASIRSTCHSLGIDLAGADRAGERHGGKDNATLPWLKSPREFARNTEEVLRQEISHSADVDECLRIFTEDFLISMWPQWGYLQVALTVDHSEWSTACKQAALHLSCRDPMDGLETSLAVGGDMREQRDDCEALKAWLVYNILVVDALQKHPLSEECKEILDQLLLHDVGRLGEVYSEQLQTGALADEHPLKGVDQLLLNLGAQRPELGETIRMLLGAWSRILRGEGDPSEVILDEVLAECLPDIDVAPSLDGEVIGENARQSFRDFMANMEFANSFRGLTSQPEWSDPMEGVRELVAKEFHKVNIYHNGTLFSPRSIECIQRIVDGMDEKPSLVIPSSSLRLASQDSSSIESIIDGLREYLATGQKSFADYSGVASMHKEQLDRVVQALDLMRELVGPEKIHIVTDSSLDDFIESGVVREGMLFGVGTNVQRLPTIAINLMVKSDPDEEIATEARAFLKTPRAWPSSLAGAVRRAVANFVVPTLAVTEGGADQEGLVGFKPLTALEIAERKGHVQPLPRDRLMLPYVLQVLKVTDTDEQDALDPVDVEDSSLTPSR